MDLPEKIIRWLLDGDEWRLFAGSPPVLIGFTATILGGLITFIKKDNGMTMDEADIACRQLRQRLHANPELAVLDLCYESIQKMAVETRRSSAQQEGVTCQK